MLINKGVNDTEAIIKTKCIDRIGFLSPQGNEKLEENFTSIIKYMLELGVPESKLCLAFMWLVRTHGWVGTMVQASNIAGSSVNILLDFDFLRLGFGCSVAERQAHLIPYLLMNRSQDRPVWDLPFANDQWPPSLHQILTKGGWKGPFPKSISPYKMHSCFPCGKNPFVTNANKELAINIRSFVGQTLSDYSSKFLVSTDKLFLLLHKNAGFSTERLINELGLATFSIFCKFGRDFFRLSRREYIYDELNMLFPQRDTINDIEIYDHLFYLNEAAIATLSAELRKKDNSISCSGKEEPVKWKHIELSNPYDEDIEFFLLINGKKTDKKIIHLKSHFTYGVRENGIVEIIAEGFYKQKIDIFDGLDVYIISFQKEGTR